MNRRDLDEQAGAAHWILEWRVEADSPLCAPCIEPVSMVAGNNSGYSYHVTIGSDVARLARFPGAINTFVDLEPGPHNYRLEFDNSTPPGTFAYFIDDELIEQGPAEGVYPTADAAFVWGFSNSQPELSTARWDYVYFGEPIPEPIPTVSEWGAVLMALLFVTTGALTFRRRGRTAR